MNMWLYKVLEITDKDGIPKDDNVANIARGEKVYLFYKGIDSCCEIWGAGFVINMSFVKEFKEYENGITIITKNSIYTLEKQEENFICV